VAVLSDKAIHEACKSKAFCTTRAQRKLQSRSWQSRDGEFSNSAAIFTFTAMQYEEMYLCQVVILPDLVCRNRQNNLECQV